jgi:hypothetical protein
MLLYRPKFMNVQTNLLGLVATAVEWSVSLRCEQAIWSLLGSSYAVAHSHT